jgi:hypothetical protein
MKRLARSALATALVAALAGAAGAQISPGELASPHAAFEGSAHCLTCHRAGQGVDAALCLACHAALGERVRTGAGLHRGAEFERCERCHSEHNGRDFALVFWEGGEAAFDHARTGWELAGRHAKLACRDCHRAERVAPRVRELEPAKDLARTYLGLPTDCADCHADPHRGSMRGGCSDCHSQESWKAPRAFDHAATRFPLDAAHARADCSACHEQVPSADVTAPAGAATPRRFDQFRGRTAMPACAECHRDPHAGRLGVDCASCHSTATFRVTDRRAFDHDRTAYPLRGRHVGVTCERCHAPQRALRITDFERCESCHRDPHLDQLDEAAERLATRGDGCATCHTVESFVPARYGPEEHAESRLPLGGAHRAVPCNACHAEAAAAELPSPFRRADGERVRRFRFADVACASCHRDPHAGELAHWEEGAGCGVCHDEERWRPARFDHARTRFQLAGAHARVDCIDCHPRGAAGSEAAGERRFAGRPLDCAGCHRDVHQGQLAVAGATDCARCHGVERFRPVAGFDHATSRYPLDGRHVDVPCAGCHPRETTATGEMVRYKPRPTDCGGCHGGARSRP